jgi:Ca-activated chloride channel family protein
MEWQRPEWLYLIVPLSLAWLALSLFSRRRRHRAAEAFVAQAMWSRILPTDSQTRFWTKLLLRETAIIAGVVALAGPRFGTLTEEVIPRGSDLYVLIDVSRSMLAEDVPPSRLGRAKADVAALVNRLDGERVGLVAFAGQAVVKCPLTVDYDAFRRALDELDPSSAPRGGTAIGDAIRKALEVFQARADRDQAILLITDGDDQESYPLEAAAVAAERHVTIFTVGLGDTSQGARIPQTGQGKSFVEYEGHQVWSKLNGSLLKEIALKTSGVYVPVETRAYDLGELYAKYLQGRRGSDSQSRTRIRRADQFQIFLAIAVLALIADAFTRLYRAPAKTPEQGLDMTANGQRAAQSKTRLPADVASLVLVLMAAFPASSKADDASQTVREGLRLYNSGEFEKARDRFDVARTEFHNKDAAKAAIAAFDEACAAHRKGDLAQAREWYLKAGLAHDKRLTAAAQFNLGTLAAEEARKLAGKKPEDVEPDKRAEIIEQLTSAIASFRHTLDLQPDNAHARRDIELVRQWIKYYTERWRARDREKKRQEMNLVAFLEFLIETERGLRESTKALPATAPADAYAELKRLQDELREEIDPLKDKIKAELTPQPSPGAAPSRPNSSEVEQGITLLQGWADAAGEKMKAAAHRLEERKAGPAATEQQTAIDELERIWDAVIPFHALLARDLADQTKIAGSLAPAESGETKPVAGEPSEKEAPAREKQEPAVPKPPAGTAQQSLGSQGEDLAPISESQERTERRTQLLKLKAEAELARLPVAKPADAKTKGPATTPKKDASANANPSQPDPKELAAGYQKAIELAPRAVDEMEKALTALKQKDRAAAYPPAEEARRILEEIQKAQPKNPQQDQNKQDQDKQEQNQKNQEQQKKEQEKDQQNKDEQKKEQQKKDQENEDQQKKDQQKKDQQKKQEDQKKEQQKSDAQQKEQQKEQQKKEQDQKKQGGGADQSKQAQKQQQPQVSRDRIEEALRQVRERQQEKRERDRRVNARIMGRVPVEKDW